MTSREQDASVERLALEHGRVCVRDWAREAVMAFVPNGLVFLIDVDGIASSAGLSFSVDWPDEDEPDVGDDDRAFELRGDR